MSGLLKSDFYKLSKMKSFPICLLIVVALTVGSVFIQDYSAQFLGEGIVYNGSNQLLSTFAGDCKIFIAIVVSIFAASEFGFGTIKNTASRGFSRISIYFSKLIVSCFIALMIQLVYSILLTFAYTAVFVMVAMLIRQSGGAIAINLCITMQFIYLFVSLAQMALHEFFNLEVALSDYLLSTNAAYLVNGQVTNEMMTRSLAVGIIYFIAFTVLGLWSFQKRDIK